MKQKCEHSTQPSYITGSAAGGEPAGETDANDAMKEHGLLNRKAQINININEHSVITEDEENTDIIHNLGMMSASELELWFYYPYNFLISLGISGSLGWFIIAQLIRHLKSQGTGVTFKLHINLMGLKMNSINPARVFTRREIRRI